MICDEDAYFQELVRYIHLNPLRANLVKNLSDLDRYAWSGHRAIMGRKKSEWQDTDYVLSWFGKEISAARKAYRGYLKEINDFNVILSRQPTTLYPKRRPHEYEQNP